VSTPPNTAPRATPSSVTLTRAQWEKIHPDLRGTLPDGTHTAFAASIPESVLPPE